MWHHAQVLDCGKKKLWEEPRPGARSSNQKIIAWQGCDSSHQDQFKTFGNNWFMDSPDEEVSSNLNGE